MEDAAGLLSDVVSSLDNLPSEVHFLCQEIGHLEARGYDYRNRGAARDSSIQKYSRPISQGGLGLLVVNPKEESGILKIRNEFIKAEDLAREKVALAERGVNLLSRHLTKLTAQLETLTPNVPPLPILPTYAPAQHAPAPTAQYNQPYSTPTAASSSQQQYQNSYQAGAFGMGTGSTSIGAPGSGGSYNYGTPIDKNKRPMGSTDLGGSQAQLAANHQLQNSGHHPHAGSPGYPFPSPVPLTSSASGSRVARPSRLNTVYPNTQSPHSHLSVGQMAQQQQLHLQQQAQRMHVQQQQQQQMVVQQQQQQIMQQQQQLQQQQQQLQSQQQSGGQSNHHHSNNNGSNSSSQNKRRRISDGDVDEEGADEEGADGEDQTPYCFCQRPSFGEMIGCDAPDCAIEWFHLSCVGLKSTPEGSWFCSNCEPKRGTGSTRGGRRK